jgi:hypothetical protein
MTVSYSGLLSKSGIELGTLSQSIDTPMVCTKTSFESHRDHDTTPVMEFQKCVAKQRRKDQSRLYIDRDLTGQQK